MASAWGLAWNQAWGASWGSTRNKGGIWVGRRAVDRLERKHPAFERLYERDEPQVETVGVEIAERSQDIPTPVLPPSPLGPVVISTIDADLQHMSALIGERVAMQQALSDMFNSQMLARQATELRKKYADDLSRRREEEAMAILLLVM